MSYMSRFWVIASLLVVVLWGCEQQSASNESSNVAVVADSNMVAAGPGIKIGYLNSLELLSLMPDAMEADEAIQSYAAGQERRFQNLMQEYQTKVQNIQENGASMMPMQQQVAMQEIQKLEQQIQDMQANSQQRIAVRRDELLAPVMARADSIIRMVAEQNGFDLIYDSPTLLYADSSLNVMPLVKEAMGIEDSEESEEGEE